MLRILEFGPLAEPVDARPLLGAIVLVSEVSMELLELCKQPMVLIGGPGISSNGQSGCLVTGVD